jgi:uncharacterized protein
MNPMFLIHNRHLNSMETFLEQDPNMLILKEQALVYHFPLLDNLPLTESGIYSITGGRQIGKTTILKQWMIKLLTSGVKAENIAFFTGELIDDHHTLVRLLSEYLSKIENNTTCYIAIDEITYVKHWDKGVKFLADTGLLRNTVLVISGSDSFIIREARTRFPGRRGRANTVDFHLFPLSFFEYLTLKHNSLLPEAEKLSSTDFSPSPEQMTALYEAFYCYLKHGGYLIAINDLEKNGTISASTFATYSDWIRGDVLKRGKQEHYLKEVLTGIIKRYSSQLTWNSLAKDLSIDHPATVIDYVELLSRMDVTTVQCALREDQLTAAPKKARKVIFNDPFVFHAVRSWLHPNDNPYKTQVEELSNSVEWTSKLVESCVSSHFSRIYPTFYIKAAGEVDIAYVKNNRFWPVEVKWTNQMNSSDLKQIQKYRNAQLFCKTSVIGEKIKGIPVIPLPLALARLGPSPSSLIS